MLLMSTPAYAIMLRGFDWQRCPVRVKQAIMRPPAGILAEAEDAERLLAGAAGDAVRNLVTAAIDLYVCQFR